MDPQDMLGLKEIIHQRRNKLSAIEHLLDGMTSLIDGRNSIARQEVIKITLANGRILSIGPTVVAGDFPKDNDIKRKEDMLRDEIFSYVTLLLAKANEQYDLNMTQMDGPPDAGDDIPF